MDTPPPTDDLDATSQLFRDNDDLGPDSSLFLRCARMFIRDGKPLGQITVLALPLPEHGSLPFGALTLTKKNRIVFWPVLPREAEMVARKGQMTYLDHLTLEFPSEKIHATAYDARGKSLHYGASDLGHSQSWRLQPFDGTGLAFWFSLLVRWSVLRNQDFAAQRPVPAPPTDAERRKEEIARFAQQMKVMDVPLQMSRSAGDYVYCVAYVVTDTSRNIQLSPHVYPIESIASQVSGYVATRDSQVHALKLKYAERQFVFTAECPPGQLLEDVNIAFPRRHMDNFTRKQ